MHAMKGYKMHAFPHDELLAVLGSFSDEYVSCDVSSFPFPPFHLGPSLLFSSPHSRNTYRFNGWGVTLVDSLDTKYIMGLHDDFEDALGFVGNLTFLCHHVLPIFSLPFPVFLLPSLFIFSPSFLSFLDLNSRTPVPSQPPTPTSSKQSFATSAASSQHTRSPPPRSSAQKLTILEGSSCLRLILLWGCLCLLLILIPEWACLILLFPFHFFNPLFRVMVEVFASAHIVSVPVLIADETTLTRLLHYLSPLSPLSFIPSFLDSDSFNPPQHIDASSVRASNRFIFSPPHPFMSSVILRTILTHAGIGVGLRNVARPRAGLRSRTSPQVAPGPSPALCYVQAVEPRT